MTATKIMDVIEKNLQIVKIKHLMQYLQISDNTGRYSKITENSEVRMSRRMDTSSKTQMTEITIQYGRSSYSSWTESVCIVRTIISRSFIQTLMEKNTKLTINIWSVETRIILVAVRWRHQNIKKEVEYSVHEEKLMKIIDLTECTSFFDHLYLWCTQRECNPIEYHYWRIHKDVRIAYFCWTATEKLLSWEEPHAKTTACSYDMEGHARKYVERYNELISKKVE